SAVRGDGVDVRLFRGDTGLSRALWQADRVLLRQTCRVSGQQEGSGGRRWNDAVWAGLHALNIDIICANSSQAKGRVERANGTLQYDHVRFILEPNAITRSLACKRVMVLDYPDGRLAIRHNGVDLPYRTFDKRQQVNQAAIVENKRLGPVLAYIAEKQKELDMSRSSKAPRRRGQRNHMFKVR